MSPSLCLFFLEPGYYEDGQFGIRLENIIRIVPAETKYKSKTRYLTFADVTLVPIQTKMLLPNLLTKEEVFPTSTCQHILSPLNMNTNFGIFF